MSKCFTSIFHEGVIPVNELSKDSAKTRVKDSIRRDRRDTEFEGNENQYNSIRRRDEADRKRNKKEYDERTSRIYKADKENRKNLKESFLPEIELI